MKRPLKILDYNKNQTAIKNRLSARKSAEKKTQTLHILKCENEYLKLRNKNLEDRIMELEKVIQNIHLHSTNTDIVQLSHH